MKTKFYFLLFVFCICSGSLFAQIPNGGFEDWTLDADNNLNPDSWQTTNSYPLVSVEQYTPAYVGNFSLKAKAFNAGPFNLGGIANISFPFTLRPTHLHVCYKATIMPGDTAYIMFASTVGGAPVAAADSCTFRIDSTVSSFTCVNMPLAYINSSNPDTALIFISGGNLISAVIGTEIIVDELSFIGVGIEETETNAIEVQSYPNPVSNVMNIPVTVRKNSRVTVHIYDETGRKVESREINLPGTGEQKVSVTVRDLADGTYTYRVIGDEINLKGSFVMTR